jgi:TRAP-type C4-dicarboxylate transport system permease large subunit
MNVLPGLVVVRNQGLNVDRNRHHAWNLATGAVADLLHIFVVAGLILIGIINKTEAG